MYKRKFKQLTLVDDIYLPFGGKLNAENRWVKISNAIPWFAAEEIYANNFTASNGSPALSARSALAEVPEKIKQEISITYYWKISYRISMILIIVTTLRYF